MTIKGIYLGLSLLYDGSIVTSIGMKILRLLCGIVPILENQVKHNRFKYLTFPLNGSS